MVIALYAYGCASQKVGVCRVLVTLARRWSVAVVLAIEIVQGPSNVV